MMVNVTDSQLRAAGACGPASTLPLPRRLPHPIAYCSDSYLNETRNFVR
jgi:hypothetical protein